MKNIQPSIWIVQETKLKSKETIPSVCLNDFQVYYLNRVAFGVSKDFESTLINEGDDETEVVSVKVNVKCSNIDENMKEKIRERIR